MIFSMLNLEKIWQQNLTDCPPHLSDVATVPWEIQKIHFQQNYSYTLLIIYITSQEKIYNLLAHPPENVTTLTYELQNFFIWLKVCCVLWLLSNVGGSEKGQLWVVVGSSEKNRLWCVAMECVASEFHSKCSEWPPSALIHTSSLFRHWSVA